MRYFSNWTGLIRGQAADQETQNHQSRGPRKVFITNRSNYRPSLRQRHMALEPLEKRLCLSDISFAPSIDIPNGRGLFNDPLSVAVGDFNEDGNQDMVVANAGNANQNGTLTVLYGNGRGGFSNPLSIPVGSDPQAVTVGYFNGDNHLDLAVANLHDSVNVIMNKGGDSGFDLEHIQTYQLPAVSFPRSLIATDVNGDGRQDLVTANTSSIQDNPGGVNSVSVLLANSVGAFFSATTSPVDGVSNLRSVAMVQFDADSIPDLAVVGQGGAGGASGVLKVLKGKGDGTFSDTNTSYSVGNDPTSVAVGYIDRAGSAPFFLAVTGDFDHGHVSVLVGDGKGDASSVQTYNVGSLPYAVAVGDFNGDGQPDLVVANHDSHSVTALRGLRNPNSTDLNDLYSFTLDQVHEFPVSGEASSLAIADFNGDHLPDVAVANGPDNSVSLLINNTIPPPNPLVVNTLSDVTDSNDEYTSLREAVDYAVSQGGADTITFDPAIFVTPQEIVLAQGELHLMTQTGTGNPTAITISGPAAGVTILVSSDNPDRVFQIDAGVTASLSGLTITGGQAAPGGGVSNAGALTLTNCTVTGNSAFGAGGGIFNDASGTLRVDASVISGNTAATEGGGIANFGSLVIVNNSTIGGTSNTDENHAGDAGGGIYNFGSGSLNIYMSTIDGNSAPDGGGIYYASSQTAEIFNSVISGNTATEGGGIFDEGPPMTITLSTISGNTASINGGGLFNQGYGVIFEDSTVSGNTAAAKGGGIYNTFGTMLTIAGGSTIGGPDYKNSATDGGGIYNAGTLNIIDGSMVAGNSVTDGGGGVYNDTFSFVTIIDSEIGVGNLFALRNTATNGAGIYNLGYLTLTDGSISDNFATGSGGGIYNSGLLAMAGTTLTNNHAAEFGGAIYLDASGGLVIVGVSVFGNSAGATNGGGGIAIRPGGLLLYIVSYIYDNTRGDVVDLT